MKVNGIDIRKYDAKQLTVDVQPPGINVNYEWITRALLPAEFDTDVTMGHLKLSVYFRGQNRNKIIRTASEFMQHFTKSCDLNLDGFKGTYKGYMTSSDYEKKNVKNRYVLNLEFDGFFYDDQLDLVFDGKKTATVYNAGTRSAPCIIAIYAKSVLTNYEITGLSSESIVVEALEAGKTMIIDGIRGIVTVDGKNAFNRVNMWEFPRMGAGEITVGFSSDAAKVNVKYSPMWI